MRRLAGQAVRHGGRLLHALAELALALLVVASVALAAAAWRLSRGPVELTWLAPLLQSAANADAPAQLTLGGAAVAWEGFRTGLDQPLDIRLHDVALTDPAGRRILAVPRAAVALSPGWLLVGRLVPWAIELDGVRLHLLRAADGALRLDLPGLAPTGGPAPDLPALLRELAARPGTDRAAGGATRWSQLRRVRIDDAALDVTDRRLGTAWRVPTLWIDLRRYREGGVAGTAEATLSLGDLSARVAAEARLDADGRQTALGLRLLAPINPAALARALPQAASLAAIDAPAVVSGTARLGPDLAPVRFALTATLGAGVLHLGQGTVPVIDAEASAEGTPARFAATLQRLVTAPRPDGPRTTVTGHGELARSADAATVTVTLDADRVAFADLPALWPEGIGEPGARSWITRNITDGLAHDAHAEMALTALADLSDATLTRLAGGADGNDVTVHWLRPVPPIVHGAARLNFLNPDSLEVVASGGRETIGRDTIALRGGRVVFTGLMAKDQFADITADLAGPVPAALALLGQPRIGLLARSPLRVQDAAGQFAGRVTLTHLPLRDDLNLDDIQIRSTLRLTGARLAGIAAGRDLDQGTLDLAADPDGLHVVGQARLAGVPAQLQADMDFRAGPPTQVLQSISVKGTLDAAQLAGLGVDAAPYAAGTALVAAHVALRRDGSGDAAVAADLTGTALTLDALAWAKPRDRPAQAEAHLLLDHDRIAGIDRLHAAGDGMELAASAGFADGRPDLVRLDRLVLGPGTDVRGTIHVPLHPDDPWLVDFFGRSLDASAALRRSPGKAPAHSRGPPYAIDARFDRVVLGPDRAVAAITVHAESDGDTLRRLELSGQTGGAQPFYIGIQPAGAQRRLSGSVADTGALLRALDVVANMQGGRLTLTGSYDDAAPGHPLAGRAEIGDFRIRHAPVLAKLLQAMTLYGLVDVMEGPGLGFSRLVAPFRLADEVLELHDARAFSPSLGMTAKGRLDLARQTFDMEGTIVPAYFFNSLLGDLPIVGRMFSPERGGGVFAATYTLRGPLDDPKVAVNPLAALTPGFLRGVFGLLDRAAPGH